ncbi:MAG: cytochrome d ubiquinol oxidase subunit II, partial [Lactococcus garvieae]
SLVGGVAVALMSFLHGLNYIALKTEGNMRKRANDLANKLYFVLYAGEVVFALLIAMKTDFIEKHAALTIGLLAVIVLLTVFAHVSVAKKREMSAFLSSGLTFLALVALLFQGLFPRVMIAENPAYSILIKDASSTHYTLTTMSYITIAILPFVLAYMAWTYYIFRKRISE